MTNRAGILAGWRRGFAIATLMLATLIAGAAAEAQTYTFSSLLIEGNQRVEIGTIRTYAGITIGQAVDAAEVNDARQRLQNSGLFESVDVIPRGNTLTIIVREYPTINQIAIEGNRRLSDEDLMPLVTSQPRRVYSPSQAEQDAAILISAYRQAGRLTATVTPVIIRRSDNRVDLVFEVTEGRVTETERIAFVGNRSYSDRRLRRVLESTQAGFFRTLIGSDTYVEDRVAFDQQLLVDFYNDRGFVDFAVLSVTSELSRERNAYFLTFNVREGQSFNLGSISVSSDLPEVDTDVFMDAINLDSGRTYSPRLVDSTITRLESLASSMGMRFIRVEPRITRNDAALTLDVEFVVTRGDRVFIERIDIEGNATTLDRVIRRQFGSVEGDPFDPRAIRMAADRIRALGYFTEADIEAREGSAPDQMIIDVNVTEQPTGSLGFGINYATDAGVGFGVDFAERNFLGRGQTVELALDTAAGSRSFNFSFLEPAFMRRDLGLGLGAYYQTTTGQNAAYDTRNIGVRASLGFPVSENGRLAVNYQLSEDSLLNIPLTSSTILQADEGAAITSALGYAYTFSNIGTGLDPNTGFLLRFGQEFAGLGGDTRFVRTTALARAETRVLREEIGLSATVEGGALNSLDGNSRLTDRFTLNSRQMRGFDSLGLGPRDLTAANSDALGGNFFAVARFEADFPLGLPDEYGITGGVFYDIGSVWGLDTTAGSGGPVDDSMYLRSTVGFSIFWDTQIGPLRFNFSRPLMSESYDQTRNFEFTIQTSF